MTAMERISAGDANDARNAIHGPRKDPETLIERTSESTTEKRRGADELHGPRIPPGEAEKADRIPGGPDQPHRPPPRS